MGALRHFGDQLLHDHIEHCACGKAQQIRQRRDHQLCSQNGKHGADGLHNAGENAAPEGLLLFHSFCPQWHGNDGTFGEVLNGDAQGQRQRTGGGDLGAAGEVSGIHHTHGHALRNVVERDGEYHHGRPLKLTFGAFGLAAFYMQVGNNVVKREQKCNADPKAQKSGQESQLSHPGRLLDSRDQQTPHGSSHHHPGSKAGQRALHRIAEGFFHKEHTGSAQ